VHRRTLSELIRLFSSSVQIDELLERVVSKSTEVLGDTAFIVLSADTGQLKLESAFSTDRERLIKMLVTTVNIGEQALREDLLASVLTRREPVVLANVLQANMTPEMRSIVEKHSVTSLLAVPIQTKDAVLGAFISLGTQSKVFTNDDVTPPPRSRILRRLHLRMRVCFRNCSAPQLRTR
jgi:transcriptional regulator with GAF, ATPase, and Fis domain